MRKILFPVFLITPFFCNSWIFLLTLSFGIIRSFEISLILIFGISSYFNMPREDYPEIKENLVFITSIYPGNTSEDLEKLITEPLEDKLKSINNIDKITSSSQENFSIIVIRFNDDIGYTEAKLKVKDEKFTHSLKYAERIQQAILPLTNQFLEVFDDFFVIFKPKLRIFFYVKINKIKEKFFT